MNLTQIRTLTRTHEDLEEVDLPDDLLDQWALEAYQNIQVLIKDWSFYQANETIAVEEGTNTYSLSTVSSDKLELLEEATWGALERIDFQTGRDKYFQYGTTFSGYPRHFAVWGDQIRLFPDPDDTYSIQVFGYREAGAWPDSSSPSSEPDMPEKFHTAIFQFVLHRALLQQDDGERARWELEHYNSLIQELATDDKEADAVQPFQLGGTAPKKGLPYGNPVQWTGV